MNEGKTKQKEKKIIKTIFYDVLFVCCFPPLLRSFIPLHVNKFHYDSFLSMWRQYDFDECA